MSIYGGSGIYGISADHVNIRNPLGYIYIIGDENTDGSVRFSLDGDVAQIEKRVLGAWVRGELELSPSTLLMGKNMAVSTAGHFLVTEHTDGSHKELYAHTEFTDLDRTGRLQVLNLSNKILRSPIQPDDTNEIIGTQIDAFAVGGNVFTLIISASYIQVGSVEATEPVTVTAYYGLNDSAPIIWDERLPAAQFQKLNINVTGVTDDGGDAVFNFATGNEYDVYVGKQITLSGFTNYTNGNYVISDGLDGASFKLTGVTYNGNDTGNWESDERRVDFRGLLEIEKQAPYMIRFASSEQISLKSNVSQTSIWLYGDFYLATFDVALITKEWTEGDPTELEDYHISHDDKAIYSANEEYSSKGVDFDADRKYFNKLSPFVFSWEKLPSDQNLLIPENHQMAVHGTFTLEGDLNLQGTLVMR